MSSTYAPKVGGTNQMTIQKQLMKRGAQIPPGMTLGDDFPMVCETCLGVNPYVRMIKRPNSKQCQISKRPFTAFRWKGGENGRIKETIICYEVAAEKNICQACLCDMEYGLPVGVRDAFMAAAESMHGDVITAPTSEINQAYYYQQQAQMIANGETSGTSNGNPSAGQAMLNAARQFANKPYQTKRKNPFKNLPKLCTFWLNGKCSKVGEKLCQLRPCCGAFAFPEIASSHPQVHHQLIQDLNNKGPYTMMTELPDHIKTMLKNARNNQNAQINIQQRYDGTDPHSQKIVKKMKRNHQLQSLVPPSDPKVTTLFLRGLADGVMENDIHHVFSGYGAIRKIHRIPVKRCAFVSFKSRIDAEEAIKGLEGTCIIKGKTINVSWAETKKPSAQQRKTPSATPTPKAAPKIPPPPPGMKAGEKLPEAPKGLKAFVPKNTSSKAAAAAAAAMLSDS